MKIPSFQEANSNRLPCHLPPPTTSAVHTSTSHTQLQYPAPSWFLTPLIHILQLFFLTWDTLVLLFTWLIPIWPPRLHSGMISTMRASPVSPDWARCSPLLGSHIT